MGEETSIQQQQKEQAGLLPSLPMSPVWMVKAGRDMWTKTKLGIDNPYLFPPGMFTDIGKWDLTEVLHFVYPDLHHHVVLNPPYTSHELKVQLFIFIH